MRTVPAAAGAGPGQYAARGGGNQAAARPQVSARVLAQLPPFRPRIGNWGESLVDIAFSQRQQAIPLGFAGAAKVAGGDTRDAFATSAGVATPSN
jgi:hypothetical protein